jgi:hypothetical protein
VVCEDSVLIGLASDKKTNEYIRGKMDAQDMILDDITRKQLIWYGHVKRMDPTTGYRIGKILQIYKLLRHLKKIKYVKWEAQH